MNGAAAGVCITTVNMHFVIESVRFAITKSTKETRKFMLKKLHVIHIQTHQ